MIFPTIHLNGSSPEQLHADYLAAYQAIRAAESALQSVEFNARDYYPQSGDAWKRAVAERTAQLTKLSEVAGEILEIIDHVQDAIDAKERQRAR